MVSQKQLTKLVNRRQRISALGRKGISGNFVIYTTDNKRFVIPLTYIGNNIIKQLFRMSAESFGLPSEGPINLPCDGVFMEYAVTLIKKGLAKDTEKALLMSMESSCCSQYVSFHQAQTAQQVPSYGY